MKIGKNCVTELQGSNIKREIKVNPKKLQVTKISIDGLFSKKKAGQKTGKVPGTGIEPAHRCQYQILSLTRLPIPPSGLVIRITGCKCKDLTLFIVK